MNAPYSVGKSFDPTEVSSSQVAFIETNAPHSDAGSEVSIRQITPHELVLENLGVPKTSTSEAGSEEISVFQVGSRQVGSSQVSMAQVSMKQAGILKDSASQISSNELTVIEFQTTEVNSTQVDASKLPFVIKTEDIADIAPTKIGVAQINPDGLISIYSPFHNSPNVSEVSPTMRVLLENVIERQLPHITSCAVALRSCM